MEEVFSTPLGDMKINEYYLYYDRPFIFQCEDDTQRKYIVHLIDDNDSAEIYFFIPTSDSRIEAVRTGKISLRESIINCENKMLWEVVIPFDGSSGTIIRRDSKNLKEDELPGSELFLDLPDNRLPQNNGDIEKEAQQLYRDILYLYLNDGNHSQLMNADYVGSALVRSQNLIYSLVADQEGSVKGRISRSTKEKATLNFAGNFAASVGIKLEAKSNELIDSSVQNALGIFLDLLDASASTDKQTLKEILDNIHNRSVARYRYFLQGLQQANINFKAEWGSPKKGKKGAALSTEQINAAIALMDFEGENITQKVTLAGDLMGLIIDNEKNRFSFEFRTHDGERYRGTLSEELRKTIDSSSINFPAKNISVELEETLEINSTTSEEYSSYMLLSIK